MNYLKIINIVTCLFLISNCDNPITNNQISTKGTIQKQSETSYMYGTHIIKNDDENTIYALTSPSIKLGNFEGKNVLIEGKFVEGYPIDGGPKYLEVIDIEEK